MAQKVCTIQKSDGAHVGLIIKINLYDNFIDITINNDNVMVQQPQQPQQMPMNYISTRTLEENR